jgi:hypothetical protein
MALGLEKRERATIDLAAYLARGRTATDALADAATTVDATTDAAA